MSILDKNFPLRTIGVAEHEDFKIFWDRLPQTPLAAHLFRLHVIPQWLKISREMGEANGTFFQYFATGT